LPLPLEVQQANPKQSIGEAEFGFGRLAMDHGKLISDGQVFEGEPGTVLKKREQGAQQSQNDIEHGRANLRRGFRKINVFGALCVFRYPQGKFRQFEFENEVPERREAER